MSLVSSSSREAAEPGQSEMLGILLIALNASCLVMGAGAAIMEAGDACGCWDRCVMSKVKVKTVKVTPVVLAEESKDEVNETVQELKQRLAARKHAYEAQLKAALGRT